jgi:hypothetical protein
MQPISPSRPVVVERRLPTDAPVRLAIELSTMYATTITPHARGFRSGMNPMRGTLAAT